MSRNTQRWETAVDRSKQVPADGSPYSQNLFSYPVNNDGRYLKVELVDGAQSEYHTRIVEIEVISGSVNVGLNKPAKAMTTNIWCTDNHCTAGTANDGNYYVDSPDNGWSPGGGGYDWWMVDLGSITHVDSVRIQYWGSTDGKFSFVPASITIRTVTDTAISGPYVSDLSMDFELGSWTLNDAPAIKGGNVKTLEIEAIGLGGNAGITMSICYDLYPGDEPWMTKWFKIRTDNGFLDSEAVLDTVIFDEFQSGPSLYVSGLKAYNFTNLKMIPATSQAANGLMVSNLNYMDVTRAASGNVRLGYAPNYWFSDYMDAAGHKTTKVFEGFWDNGSIEAGEFQYQVFLISRHILTTSHTTKPMVGEYASSGADANLVKRMGYGGLGYVSTGTWSKDYFSTNQIPQFADKTSNGTFSNVMAQNGLSPYLYIGVESFPPKTGIYPDDVPSASVFGGYLGRVTLSAGAVGWFIEDGYGVNYLSPNGPGGYVDAMWREGFRTIIDSIKAAMAPATVSVGRTWVNLMEVFDIQDWSSGGDYDNYAWADAWLDRYQSRIPIQPNFIFHCWHPVYVINHTMSPRPGKAARDIDDLDFTTARTANMGIMWTVPGVGGPCTPVTEEEIPVHKKWTDWHNANADWLEYTQKLEVNGTLPAGVKGMTHLRNLYNGKYGFISWWNAAETPATVSPVINTAKWMLNIDADHLRIRSVRTGDIIPFTVNGNQIAIGPVSTPLWSYDVLELSDTLYTGRESAASAVESFAAAVWPNPFNPGTTITLSVPTRQTVTLEIFNIAGKRILTLFQGVLPAGHHNVIWNGKDQWQKPVAAGLYILKARAENNNRHIVKLAIVK
ncbi:MAG: FlgD immunoglobulin-like domain containing protein [Fibrobacterota bacterium]